MYIYELSTSAFLGDLTKYTVSLRRYEVEKETPRRYYIGCLFADYSSKVDKCMLGICTQENERYRVVFLDIDELETHKKHLIELMKERQRYYENKISVYKQVMNDIINIQESEVIDEI